MPENKKAVIDTNILVRFLVNDAPEQVSKIEALFKKAKPKEFIVDDVMLIECAFVMLSWYKLSKEEVIEKLGTLILYEKFDVNITRFQRILELYSSFSISFIDAYLSAIAVEKNLKLYTFDEKLLKSIPSVASKP